MTRKIYFIEVTDTFGGDLNYCWTRRYAVKATTERGAMRVLGNHEGFALRNDGAVWRVKNACIAAYVVEESSSLEELDYMYTYKHLNFN